MFFFCLLVALLIVLPPPSLQSTPNADSQQGNKDDVPHSKQSQIEPDSSEPNEVRVMEIGEGLYRVYFPFQENPSAVKNIR